MTTGGNAVNTRGSSIDAVIGSTRIATPNTTCMMSDAAFIHFEPRLGDSVTKT
jgi:hypothetical protein